MGRRKQKIIEVEIEKLAFGGRGLARLNERVIFVEGAMPGDSVRAMVTRKKKDFWEAKTIEILKASPLRIDPPCPYHDHCGGCKWQYIGYEEQLKFKEEQVRESLERIGRFTDVPMEPILGSENMFTYRNKMEFSFSQRRWLTPEELADKEISMQFALGLHVPGTFDKVMDIENCLLQSNKANTILRKVKKWALESGIAAYHLRMHTGILRFLVIREAYKSGEIMVNIVTTESVVDAMKPLVAELTAEIPEIASIINSINKRLAQIAFGDEENLVYGKPTISDGVGDFRFEISANSFFQTNTAQAENLYNTVAEFAALTGQETLFDLYSGTGTIAIFLAKKAKKVFALELIEEAVENAKKNAADNDVGNCEFHLGDIKDYLPQLTSVKPDVLVVDPPRAGIHKDALDTILALAPGKIVYVSCNPTTLARDLQILNSAYDLKRVRPVDMFPHTYHIETVVLLEKK